MLFSSSCPFPILMQHSYAHSEQTKSDLRELQRSVQVSHFCCLTCVLFHFFQGFMLSSLCDLCRPATLGSTAALHTSTLNQIVLLQLDEHIKKHLTFVHLYNAQCFFCPVSQSCCDPGKVHTCQSWKKATRLPLYNRHFQSDLPIS